MGPKAPPPLDKSQNTRFAYEIELLFRKKNKGDLGARRGGVRPGGVSSI